MPDNALPEESVRSIYEASQTIKRKGELDKCFPDLGDTFTVSSSEDYYVANEEAGQPFISKFIRTMPPSALEQMQQWNPASPAGILLDIDRAYFVVRNRLYMWNYLDGQTVNTYEAACDIVSVAVVPPKKDIISDEIVRVLVVATEQDISLIGIANNTQSTDGDNLIFYKPDLTTSSDGVNTRMIVGSSFGRIFMLGEDGNIRELGYQREEGWFSSRCYKKLYHTSPAFSVFLPTPHDLCVAIALSDDGTCLYELFDSSAIQIVFLGADGQSFSTIFKHENILNDARRLCPDSALIDGSTFKIISIHPTVAAESKHYHLVAVTSTGCRLYFTHYKRVSGATMSGPPVTLELIYVRTPPPSMYTLATQSTGMQLPVGQGTQLVRSTVSTCLYKDAVLLLASTDGQTETVFTASLDVSRTAKAGPGQGLFELTNRLAIQGKVISMAEIPTMAFKLNELTCQLSRPPRHFLVLTTSGLTVLTKQRPIDMLQRLLGSGANVVGSIHLASLCFGIVCATSASLSNGAHLTTNALVSPAIAKGAAKLLDKLGAALAVPLSSIGSEYTSRHDGLALYIYRLIDPIWSEKIITTSTSSGLDVHYKSVVSRGELTSVQTELRQLQHYMSSNPTVFRLTEPNTPEDRSVCQLYDLVVLLIEAISFLIYLVDCDISKIMKSLKEEDQQNFQKCTFEALLTTDEGRKIASNLAGVLVDNHIAKYGNIDIVIDILKPNCGSFCRATDVVLHKSIQQIRSARKAPNTSQSRALLNESLNNLKRIAGHIPCEKLEEITKEYTSQGCRIHAINLALSCVKARNPIQTAQAGGLPADMSSHSFTAKKSFYDVVFQLLKDIANTPSSTSTQGLTSVSDSVKEQAYQQVFSFDDVAFHDYLYEKFIANNLGQELIMVDPPHLEAYLKRDPRLYELLVDYYRKNERNDEAAYCLEYLAAREEQPEKRFGHLTLAIVCANSVTSPHKKFEMLNLIDILEREKGQALADISKRKDKGKSKVFE